MKKITRLLTIAGLVFGYAAGATAGTIFTLSGTLTDDTTVTGALNIDTLLGTVDAVSLFVQDDPGDTFDNVFAQTSGAGAYFEITSTMANPTGLPALYLLIPPGSLVGYSGGDLATGPTGSEFVNASDSVTFFSSGSISPVVSTVPEPRSSTALVIGLVGFGFLARRRLATRPA